ncbi:unnamed protein product [Lactuca virosa]|uniref:Uncharacterized protein n=1 Tax=Lactuca virosa TaxID=75947 RepID=A0AAU9PNU2_9ASTR|nr:unnamed protein product [Lactuca virosa]
MQLQNRGCLLVFWFHFDGVWILVLDHLGELAYNYISRTRRSLVTACQIRRTWVSKKIKVSSVNLSDISSQSKS